MTHDQRAGLLAVLVLALLMVGLWLVSADAPAPTCTERAPAGIMCTTDQERGP